MKLSEIIICTVYFIMFALAITGIAKLAIMGDKLQQQRILSQAKMEACHDIIREER